MNQHDSIPLPIIFFQHLRKKLKQLHPLNTLLPVKMLAPFFFFPALVQELTSEIKCALVTEKNLN